MAIRSASFNHLNKPCLKKILILSPIETSIPMKFTYLWRRFAAYLIDCSLGFGLAMLFIQLLLVQYLHLIPGIDDAFLSDPWNMLTYVLLTISLPVYLFFSFFDASKNRGTPGKRWLGLQINTLDQKQLPFSKAFIRTVLKLLPWEIAHMGVIFPQPIYYTENPQTPWLSLLGLLLLLIYFLSIAFHKKSQSLYDQLLQTQVVMR